MKLLRLLHGFQQEMNNDKKLLDVFDKTSEAIIAFRIDPPLPLNLPVDDQIDWIYEHARISYLNTGVVTTYGYDSKEQLIGAPLDLLMPKAHPENIATLKRMSETDYTLIDFETIETDKNGNRLYLLNSNIAYLDNGYLCESWAITRDITEWRKLREDMQLRIAAFEGVNEGCLIVDCQQEGYSILYANKAYLDITGYSLKELLGENPRLLQGPETDPQMIKHLGEAIRKGESCKGEILNYRKNGETFWNQLSISPVRNSFGMVTHYIGIINDVTDIRLQNRSLRQKARILENTHDCVVSTDMDGVITSWNKQAEIAYGYKAEEAIGQPISILYTEDDLPIFEKELMTPLKERGSLQTVATNRSKSGELKRMELRLNLEHDREGEPIGMISCSNDVTEKIESQKRINDLQSELAHFARIAIFDELSSSLAHELNQPLAANMSNAQAALRMLEQAEPDLEEIREILGDIVADNRRAGSIVNRLRAMTKKNIPQNEILDLNEIIEETLTLLHSELVIKRISIELHLQDSLPSISADKVQIQQVIINLVKNASEAIYDSNAAKRVIDIETQSNMDIGCVECSVSDDGPGIPSDQMGKIFDRFYSTKSEGMGMGLNICQSIIQNHGGTLKAKQGPSRGSIFTFELPSNR